MICTISMSSLDHKPPYHTEHIGLRTSVSHHFGLFFCAALLPMLNTIYGGIMEGRDPYIPDTGCTQDPYRRRMDAVTNAAQTPYGYRYGRTADVRHGYRTDIVRISYGYRTNSRASYGISCKIPNTGFKLLLCPFHCRLNRTASPMAPGLQMKHIQKSVLSC